MGIFGPDGVPLTWIKGPKGLPPGLLYVAEPKRILKSGPVTIVFWRDGTKTMVRRAPGEEDSAYAAFTAALAIKVFGSNSALKRMLKAKTEHQKDKKKSVVPDQRCTDTCPIDFDAIERKLASDDSE